jgi:fermentation-respiration switch protein FrsA (DUF1100 family)
MRRDIEFKAEDGTLLRGWHYLPDQHPGKVPTVVMAHGFASVKEIYLDKYAELFAKSGIASLVYDHRCFGASDGTPRQELDPLMQIRDWRDAISFVETLPETDTAHIGIFGSSYSGGHVFVIAAQDRRVKCVVSQVPFISGARNSRRLIRADHLAPTRALLDEDRRNRYAGKPPGMIAVVTEDPAAPSALPTADSWAFFSAVAERAPAFRNEVTLRSLDHFLGYEPGIHIRDVSPTPLLMMVALQDHLTVADESLAAYEQALQPKKLIMLKGGHFDAYVNDFDVAGAGARDWFVEHLLSV